MLNLRHVLSNEIARILESQGLLSQIVNGRRKVSLVALDLEEFSSSRGSGAEVIADLEIPAVIESKETLEILGFRPEEAERLWNFFCKIPESHEIDFESFLFEVLTQDGIQDAGGDDDWRKCISLLGLTNAYADRLLDPIFDDVRLTGTCKFWCKEFIRGDYKTLDLLNSTLRRDLEKLRQWDFPKQQRVLRLPSRPGPIILRQQTQASFEVHLPLQQHASSTELERLTSMSCPTSSARHSRSTAPASKNPFVSMTTVLSEGSSRTLVATEAPEALRDLGYTTLWRACTLEKALEFVDKTTGQVRFSACRAYSGDFSDKLRLYWTLQQECALRYHAFYKHNQNYQKVAIIEINIPESFIAPLNTVCLWAGEQDVPNEEWAQVIYKARRGSDVGRLKELRHVTNSDLIMGTIASGTHKKYQDMASYREIKMEDVLTVDISGETKQAIQWVFNSNPVVRRLEDLLEGTVIIHERLDSM